MTSKRHHSSDKGCELTPCCWQARTLKGIDRLADNQKHSNTPGLRKSQHRRPSFSRLEFTFVSVKILSLHQLLYVFSRMYEGDAKKLRAFCVLKRIAWARINLCAHKPTCNHGLARVPVRRVTSQFFCTLIIFIWDLFEIFPFQHYFFNLMKMIRNLDF